MFESFPFRRAYMSKPECNPLEEREADVRAQLAPHFNDYEFMVAQLHNYVLLALKTYDAHPEVQRRAGKLEMLLLTRLLGDLRVCQRAACDGYPMQALTVASSVHEIAFGLIYLGDSADRCREWTEHSNGRKQYPEAGHYTAVQSAKDALGFSDAEVAEEYRVYTELCWGKHGNPILQRNYGALDMGSFAEVQQQPYFSDETVHFGRYAVLHACRVVEYAARVFIGLHLREAEEVERVDLAAGLLVVEAHITRLGVRDRLMRPRTRDK